MSEEAHLLNCYKHEMNTILVSEVQDLKTRKFRLPDLKK